jgi:cell division septation protein DedD
VRSRPEAEALAQKLATQQGPALKSRIPVVDEAVIGSMGTFYRVRVGSFANADEPRGVCNTLRSSGFDCLVVTN